MPSHFIQKMTERSKDNPMKLSNDFNIKDYKESASFNAALNSNTDDNEVKHDIHPAFRLQPINTQVPLLNSNYQTAAYYRGCLYNPLTSMMFLQQHATCPVTTQSYTAYPSAAQSNTDTPINLKLRAQDCAILPSEQETNSFANTFKTCV